MNKFAVIKDLELTGLRLDLQDAGFESYKIGDVGFYVVRYKQEAEQKLRSILDDRQVRLFKELNVNSLNDAHQYVANILEKSRFKAVQMAEKEIYGKTWREAYIGRRSWFSWIFDGVSDFLSDLGVMLSKKDVDKQGYGLRKLQA